MSLVEPDEILFCPLTLQLFTDPVFARDGHTYEKHAIEKWFQKQRTSPMTRQEISTDLVPNYDKKTQIDRFHQKHKILSIDEFLKTLCKSSFEDFKKLNVVSSYLNPIVFDDMPTLKNTIDPDLKKLSMNHRYTVTALCIAAEKGCIETCKELVKLGAKVNESNGHEWVPLHYAAYNGSLELVDFLLNNNANINALTYSKYTPLTLCVSNTGLLSQTPKEREDIVLKLIKSGTDLKLSTCSGMTPLHYATQNSCVNIVKHLIAAGASINILNNNGDSCLLLATQKGNAQIFFDLLNAQAHRNQPNKQGINPIHESVKQQNLSFLKHLLKDNKFDINSPASDGNTCLHFLFSFKKYYGSTKLEILNKLLDHKADPNIQNQDGDTPIHLLIKNFQNDDFFKECVRALIFSGAQASMKNKDNIVAIDLANDKNKEIINNFLVEYHLMQIKMPKFVQDLQSQVQILQKQVEKLELLLNKTLQN